MADARRIRVGVQVQPQHGTARAMRDAWLRAEELGADTVFTWDHFHPLSGDPDGNHFECWTWLGAMAEATERVEIGALVSCNSYRNPELLTDMARTVDHISDGRLILGIGSGWFERDYDEFGYEFGTAPSRLRDLDSAMPRIHSRMAKLIPPPGAKPDADHDRRRRRAGHPAHRRAERRHLEWLRRTRARSPTSAPCSTSGAARSAATPPPSSARWPASAPAALPNLDGYLDVGVTHLIMGISGPEWDLSLLPKLVEWRDRHQR